MITEFARKIEVTYDWWIDEGEINIDMVEQLDIHAKERAAEMMKEGYSSGELNYESENSQYRGHWSMTTETL